MTEGDYPGVSPSHPKSHSRWRWLAWIAFFLVPLVVVGALLWPETPDLPLEYLGWDCSIDSHAAFLPGEYVQ